MARFEVFKARFWRDYWILFRRASHDARARKAFLLTTAALLFFPVFYGSYIWGLLHEFGGAQTIAMIGAGTLLILVAFGVRWIFLREDQQEARQASDLTTDPILRQHLAADAFTLAILLARLGSERLIQQKSLPDNLEIITRRRHLGLLRDLGLWDSVPLQIRDLLLAPDGHWDADALNDWRAFETLRCLRWILRLDTELTPIAHLPRLSGNPVLALISKPDSLLRSGGMQDIWDIRLERVAADRFFSRCFAELRGRGFLPPMVNPDTLSWTDAVYEKARDPDHRDVLVKHLTVAELDEGTLRYVASVAWNRYHTLEHVMNMIDAPESASLLQSWHDFCFPQQKSPERSSA